MARAPIAVALGVVAVALALPSPQPSTPEAEPGPARVSTIWPAAAPFTFPSGLPGGFAFQPYAVVDRTTAVGVATTTDLGTTRLVVRVDGARPRVLRSLTGAQPPTVAAVTIEGDQIYWVETGASGRGGRQTTVWRAGLAGGAARRIAVDSSEVLYFDSAHDVQVAKGRVYWAATSADDPDRGEVRSVPVGGGTVRVEPLDRLFGLTAWPWMTSSVASEPGDVLLFNLVTGERRTVRASDAEILACGPEWCRVTELLNEGQEIKFGLLRADGAERREFPDRSFTPVNVDVALADRFEVLASPMAVKSATPLQRLWLYDIAADRAAILADGTTGTVGSRGSFLWWSTGDNETLAWHVLDLRQLK